MRNLKVGFAMTGSFCTFRKALDAARHLRAAGHSLVPIMSFNAFSTDTRFGRAADFRRELEEIAGREIIATIPAAEPIGPKGLLDVLLIAPCTGNTMAKLAAGIADTPVTLAAKSQLRGARPVLIALSTNDALAGAAKNIGALLNTKNVFFVPFAQDAPGEKPRSAAADLSRLDEALLAAAEHRQLQPVLGG